MSHVIKSLGYTRGATVCVKSMNSRKFYEVHYVYYYSLFF